MNAQWLSVLPPLVAIAVVLWRREVILALVLAVFVSAVLIVPPVEVIPHETLVRVAEFYDAGGIVVGCGLLPSKSATIGKTAADIAALRTAVWGESPAPGTQACRTSSAGPARRSTVGKGPR